MSVTQPAMSVAQIAMLVMQAATLVRAEITSANKVSASAGKAIVNQGEVTTLMLKTGTANPKIAMLPKRMINFMNWEVYCMFERCSQISYLV